MSSHDHPNEPGISGHGVLSYTAQLGHFADRPVSTILTFEARNRDAAWPSHSHWIFICMQTRAGQWLSQSVQKNSKKSRELSRRTRWNFKKVSPDIIRWKGTGPTGETSLPSSCNKYSKHDKWRSSFRTQFSSPNAGFEGPHKGRAGGEVSKHPRAAPGPVQLLPPCWASEDSRPEEAQTITEHHCHLGLCGPRCPGDCRAASPDHTRAPALLTQSLLADSEQWAPVRPMSYLARCACMLIPVGFFGTPWTVACPAPLSMGFPWQEYWSGLPFPSPGDLPSQPRDWTRISCISRQILYPWATWEALLFGNPQA